ncbi:WD40_repeat protein [Hexamita inflata]|uniref:WD40 repeat protein n=1 Tax=Hexamita inflata TaxID=28002 RepID=A0AA86NI47_9EUKA|nr:WD40 repeat protein [Hexamita inflata]
MQYKIPNPNCQQTFGKFTYFGCATGDIIKLDWETGASLTGSAHKDGCPIQCMAFDSKFVYTGGWDRRIFRYNRDTLALDTECMFFESNDNPEAHTDFVKSLCVSEDEKYLFSGSADGMVYRWELPQTNTSVYLKPEITKLTNRFINSIVNLNATHIACGGSSRTIYVLDHNLKLVKEQLIQDCANISKIIIKGYIFVLSKDLFILNQNLKTEMMFLMRNDPIDLYFPPNRPELFYAACEDNLKIIKYDQGAPLDHYTKMAVTGRNMTAEQVRALIKTGPPEQYEIVPSGVNKAFCGLECVKQKIAWQGIEKDCFMLVYGAHDEVARRIFLLKEDRELFIEKAKENKEGSSSIDLDDDDEDIEIDQKKMEEIKYKRLKAMLDGSETWHKDKFDE